MHSKRLVIPLPFADVTITLRTNRRARPMLWYVLLSAAFHMLAVSAFIALLARSIFPEIAQKPPQEIVAISSAVRIEHRARPVRAHNPVPRPHVVLVQKPQQARPSFSKRRMTTHVAHVAVRRELAKIAYNAPPSAQRPEQLTRQQLESQTQSFEQTIAQARAANDPVAGAATDSTTPAAPKHYALNINGTFAKPQPEGILYPLKRWVDGGYVYYYVRYTAQYADGATETGIVPWPIRFPIGADPFERDRHRMPLPGPMSDYVASADTEMEPLVKNCYDHRYDYCPIEHE
jgi:hypothetical protein